MGYKIFDAHSDTLTELLKKNETLKVNSGMVNSEMLKKYNGFIQVFAECVSLESGNILKQVLEFTDKAYEELRGNDIVLIKDKKTLDEVINKNKTGAILGIEDGAPLLGSLRVLNVLYKLGFRLITLTWNGENELGKGAIGSNGEGLTDFGKDVVKKMNELGMIVDVSHLSEKGFWDVMEITKKPIIASHSNAKAECNHLRNLTDEQIKALINTGGAIGINIYPRFLNNTDNAEIKDVIRHIEYILSLGGEDVLGIGTDFDGVPVVPVGLENTGSLYNLFDEMKKIGYGDELIEKITYKNMVRVFGECL